MLRIRRSLWEHLFGTRAAGGTVLPRRLVPPIRFAYLVIHEFSRNRCPEKASALGFQTVFSLIPAFALALFFFRVFGDFSDVGGKVEPALYRILKIDKVYLAKDAPAHPDTTEGPKDPSVQTQGDAVPEQSTSPSVVEGPRLDTKIQELVDSVYQKLSTGGLNIVSFAWLVFAAINLALTIEKSFNEIWGSVGQRRLLRRIAVYWSMLTLGPLLIGLSIYAALQVGVDSKIQEFAISVAGPLVALYLIYQLMPSAPVHPISAVAGAFGAAVLLQIASWLFGLYLTHAVGYEKLYGNLGLVPLFLFWLWISWVIVLIGAEIAYSWQNLDRLTAEERRRHGAPFIDPGLVALGLVLHAGRAFGSGRGAVEADDLAESSGLPDRLWMKLVNLLRDRGILVEAGPDGSRFIPGKPLEAIHVEDIFEIVEQSLVAQFDEIWHPEQEHLHALSGLLTRARQRELGKTSIADLLAMSDRADTVAPSDATISPAKPVSA